MKDYTEDAGYILQSAATMWANRKDAVKFEAYTHLLAGYLMGMRHRILNPEPSATEAAGGK